jgi:hypothetical protein
VSETRRGLRRALFGGASMVALFGLVAEWIGHGTLGERAAVQKAVAFFSLSYEHNLPSWYASMLLFACAIALGVVARGVSARGEPFARHWWVLAIGFGYMSLDEAVELHEHLGGLLSLHGPLYFSWIVPASAVVLIVLASYARFLRALPSATRWRFVAAGAVYVGGAVGMEIPLGWWTERHGDENFTYALIDWIEETLELLGATWFLVSVLGYLRGVATRRDDA